MTWPKQPDLIAIELKGEVVEDAEIGEHHQLVPDLALQRSLVLDPVTLNFGFGRYQVAGPGRQRQAQQRRHQKSRDLLFRFHRSGPPCLISARIQTQG